MDVKCSECDGTPVNQNSMFYSCRITDDGTHDGTNATDYVVCLACMKDFLLEHTVKLQSIIRIDYPMSGDDN